ncbi:leucine-rich repeat domain-containing protein [Streptomyces sp. NPDC002853]
MASDREPQTFVNRWGDSSTPGPGKPGGRQDACACFDQYGPAPRARVGFHAERQDTSAPGWLRLLEMIDEAAADGREEFRPLEELSPEERRQIVTLPSRIARLTAVRHLVLYRSNLVRIPPEIGAMTNLEEFTPYTSRRLHWFPYELTRCTRLTRSTVSTRALFGNSRFRPPFPRLRAAERSVTDLDPAALDPRRRGATAIHRCSVCDGPIRAGEIDQRWLSLRVATDVLPMLVNACSSACVDSLPSGADDHIPTPHKGGRVDQPPPDED